MRSFWFLGALAFGAVLVRSPRAEACGGCFHQPPSPTEKASVVTDHRMALSVSTTQTVLWDQVRYEGNPGDFAWVLPVGQGAYVELARDEWLASLDALTAPTISAPPLPLRCNAFFGGGGGACSGGFGSAGGTDNYGYADASANFDGGNGVDVISQSVVGPYLAVTIRSTSGEAISQWLLDNGFEIPTTIGPVLDAYTNAGFDFIALRLAPDEGVQAMQPVRVVTPGADPTLPLRMVAAGIGDSVGLTLYVVAEGRYESKSFPALLVDRSKVVWDPVAEKSNYTELFADTVTAGQGWVTEFAGSAGTLASVYKSTCINQPQVAVPCDAPDGGDVDAGDAGDTSDASATGDAGDTSDASDAATADEDASTDDASGDATDDASDAGDAGDDAAPEAGSCVKYLSACTFFDDYDVATKGIPTYDVFVTRLRTTLPAAALTKDLTLGASADQPTLGNTITAQGYSIPNYDPCPSAPPPKEGCGCDTAGRNDFVVSTSLGALGLVALARRRRRRSRA